MLLNNITVKYFIDLLLNKWLPTNPPGLKKHSISSSLHWNKTSQCHHYASAYLFGTIKTHTGTKYEPSMYVSIRLKFCVCFFKLLLFILLILMWGPLPFLSLLKIWNIFLREKQPSNLNIKNLTRCCLVDWNQHFLFYYNWLAYCIFFRFDGCSFPRLKRESVCKILIHFTTLAKEN